MEWDVIELLLCASDLARDGRFASPLSVATQWLAIGWGSIAVEARHEAMAVAPRAFDYCGDLLADTLLEAAYRVAEGRGAGVEIPKEMILPSVERVQDFYRRARSHIERRGVYRTGNRGPDYFDQLVSMEFHRRLKRAGIEVEQ